MEMNEWFKLRNKYLTTFKYLVCLSIFYIFPIILADRYYIDDLGRSLLGYAGWSNNGRPLTDIIMIFINMGLPIQDISPLTQISAVIILSYVLVLFARKYLSEYSPLLITCVLFFCYANPFLLENFSYKYDSLCMILGLCSIFFVFSLPDTLTDTKIFFYSNCAILFSLCIYQATIGAFICLSIFEVIINLKNNINISTSLLLKRINIRIISLFSAGIIYKIIANFCVSKSGYSFTHSKFISLTSQGIDTFVLNISNYILLIGSFIYSFSYILIIITILCIFSLILIISKLFTNNKKIPLLQKINRIIFIFLSPVLIFLGTFIPLTFLENPVFFSRTLISFSVFTIFIGVLLLWLSNKCKYVSLIFIPCLIFSYSYTYSYSNALKSQKNYDTFIIQSIVYDLNQIDVTGKFNKISIIGRIPKSRNLQLMIKKNPLFNYSVPIYDKVWGAKLLEQYMQKPKKLVEVTNPDFSIVYTKKPEVNNTLYSIYTNNDKIIIIFNKKIEDN